MNNIREAVRERYGKIGASTKHAEEGCCPPSCCTGNASASVKCDDRSAMLGYSEQELSSIPQGSNLGLGCGNPQAIAELKAGETVLDLGSGGGFDCFLAARQVGESGNVIGVDMTAEMIDRARQNADKSCIQNVQFRLGEIEHLPVADGVVDVILSNCVINLSTDKPSVFQEAFRVLRPGGRLAVSDVVATAPLPDQIRNSVELHVGCAAGAASIDELSSMLEEAGFVEIRINPKKESRAVINEWFPGDDLGNFLVSATIEAIRP